MGILDCKYGKHILYQKYVVCTMACVSLMLIHGARHTIYATVPHIITVETDESKFTEREVCPGAVFFMGPPEKVVEKHLEWSKSQTYYIFICFFVGQVLSQIPVGVLCDFYGARHIFSLAVLCTSTVIAVTPFVLTKTPWYCTAITQAAFGFLEGISLPALVSLLAHWIPNEQLTFLTAYAFSGRTLGIITSYILLHCLLYYWQVVFYIWATLTVIWYVIFLIFVYSRSTTHPFVCYEEKEILQEQFADVMPRNIPWKEIMSDVGLWALIAAQAAYNYLTLIMVMHTPKFFKYNMGFDLRDNLYWCVIPLACQWITTIISGFMGDYCITKNYIPIVYIRMGFIGIGNVLPSCFLLLATYMECNRPLIFMWFVGAMISRGCIFAGLKANILDMTRYYSGTIEAIISILAILGVLVFDQIVRFLCKRSTITEWRQIYMFSCVLCVSLTVFYAIWCKVTRAPWDIAIEKEEERAE